MTKPPPPARPDRWSLPARAARSALSHPQLLLRLLGEREPVWVDGRRLHPAMQALIALGVRSGRDDAEFEAERMRRELALLTRLTSPSRRSVHVADRRVATDAGVLSLRLYRPHGRPGALPAVVYAHGGGFVSGDLDTHDGSCRRLADIAEATVISVQYRCAPEDPFPAAVDDVVAAYRWTLDHAGELGADPTRVGAMGDSAGATLTAALCLEARRLGLPQPVLQTLIYPLTDLHLRAASYRHFAEGFGLSLRGIEWFRDQYCPDPATWDDERVSPLLASDHSGLAPAFVVTAGFDPLRDDGAAYVEALQACGVPATLRCFDDMIHGFHGMFVIPDAAAAIDEIDRHVGQLLRG